MQITKTIEIDNFILFTVICIGLLMTGLMLFFSFINDVVDEAYADIDQMGCGQLKEFIAEEGWYDYNARANSIKNHAMHKYTWTCEK